MLIITDFCYSSALALRTGRFLDVRQFPALCMRSKARVMISIVCNERMSAQFRQLQCLLPVFRYLQFPRGNFVTYRKAIVYKCALAFFSQDVLV
jgi:hypothetical protein